MTEGRDGMDDEVRDAHAAGRLLARPGATPGDEGATGLHTLQVEAGCDALLYVPAGYDSGRAAGLIVMLHGAGGAAQHGVDLLREDADERGLLLLAPASQAATWDVIVGGYGADVLVIDAALRIIFDRYRVDATRLAIGGFSDGASYALSLGLTNGDLFTDIIAFAPGFTAHTSRRGSPRIYISHGTQDRVLPIDRCSRRLVPRLRAEGCDVRYHEFDGGHTVPPEMRREAIEAFVAG